jgi:hypothetical protein
MSGGERREENEHLHFLFDVVFLPRECGAQQAQGLAGTRGTLQQRIGAGLQGFDHLIARGIRQQGGRPHGNDQR